MTGCSQLDVNYQHAQFFVVYTQVDPSIVGSQSVEVHLTPAYMKAMLAYYMNVKSTEVKQR